MSTSVSAELVETATGKRHPLGPAGVFTIGRNPATNTLELKHERVSRDHCRIARHDGRYFVESLNERNPVLLDGRAVVGRTPLAGGSVVGVGPVRVPLRDRARYPRRPAPPPPPVIDPPTAPPVRPLLTPVAPRPLPPPPAARPVVTPPLTSSTGGTFDGGATMAPSDADLNEVFPPPLDIDEFEVDGEMVIGREKRSDIRLPHPQVSRRHAVVRQRDDGRYTLQDAGSANGTFVNGKRLTNRATWLTDGDLINVGPYKLVFDDGVLKSESPRGERRGRAGVPGCQPGGDQPHRREEADPPGRGEPGVQAVRVRLPAGAERVGQEHAHDHPERAGAAPTAGRCW